MAWAGNRPARYILMRKDTVMTAAGYKTYVYGWHFLYKNYFTLKSRQFIFLIHLYANIKNHKPTLTNMMKPVLFTVVLITSSFYLFAQRELKNPLINSKDVMAKGVELHDAGKYKDAIAEYQKVPVSDTNYADVLQEMVLSYYADSNFVAAEKLAKKGLERFPAKKVSLMRLLADIYDDTQRIDDALVVYDSILAMNKYDYLTYFNKGICLYRQEKNEQAAENFRKTIMLNPYYSSAHYFLGQLALMKGNLPEAMMSFTTNLFVAPGNKYYQKSIGYLSAIAKVNTTIDEYLKNYKPSGANNFESVQDIIVSKIALDKNYKLKADLEDQIVRQMQVLFEKLEYTDADKSFYMQYYVPFFKKIWDDRNFEPFIFYVFSELNIDKVKSYVKKEKKDIEKMNLDLYEYFNKIRKTQELAVSKRDATVIKYYIKDYLVVGKGEFVQNNKGDEMLVGPWEFYHKNGKLKSKGVFDRNGARTGIWSYYYEDGTVKEISTYDMDKANGKSESWYDNGIRYSLSDYKDDAIEGVEYLYYYNGNPRSVVTYKKGKKEGPAKYYTINGALSSTCTYLNDLKEGEALSYYESGKLNARTNYKNDLATGNYIEYHENGKVLKQGDFEADKSVGPWKWFYDSGKPENTGTYADGELDGEYLSYYENGKLASRAFYKKGQVDGKREDYDEDGILFCETIFEKGRFRDIKFLDKKGNLVSNTSSRKGNANVTFYNADGSKAREGYFTKEGLQDGKGVYYFKNGKVQTEVMYKDGMQEGKKLIYYPNGKIKEEGNFSKDEPNGYFVTYYVNGVVEEEGWYVEGKKQGTFLNYDQFGNLTSKLYYLNDDVDGIAEYYTPDGKLNYSEYYDNDWFRKIVQMDTLGNVLTSSELVKGAGKVQFKHYNGKPYFESNYDHYKLNGQYKTLNGDGTVASIAYYKHGDIDSSFKAWHNNGKLRLEAQYVNTERSGTWNYYYRNGTLSETEIYERGKLNGKDVQYNEFGNVYREYEFKNGVVDGTVKYYGENKQLALVLYFTKDELTGYSYEDKTGNLVPVIPVKYGSGSITAYYRNGNKSAELTYNESLQEGKRLLYFSNGKEYVNSTSVNGTDDGVKKVYYPSGKIMKEETYVNGSLHGLSRYYAENGSLISELNYYNNDLHGLCKYYEGGKLTETLVYRYDMLESKK